jgi:hypothetical protein
LSSNTLAIDHRVIRAAVVPKCPVQTLTDCPACLPWSIGLFGAELRHQLAHGRKRLVEPSSSSVSA